MGRSHAFAQAALLAFATFTTATPLPGSAGRFAPAGRFHGKLAARGNSTKGITWGDCPDSYPTNVTCGTFTVPLDWSGATGDETIELGMVLLAASDKANRIGSMFVNPGGPGGQASDLVASLAMAPQTVDPRILERFDVIGLDPRGVGFSTPVECDTDIYNKRVSLFPKTQDEFDELVAHNKALGESCRAKTGSLIDFVDTISAVKDHEAVRKALGCDKITLLGLSYGTQLFSQYAELYPGIIRAVVLDGNLQHSQGESSNVLLEGGTYELTLKKFFEWCANATSTDAEAGGCPLAGKDVRAAYERVLAKAEASPIAASGCNNTVCRADVTAEDLLFNVQGALISVSSWPGLGAAIAAADADDADATALSQLQPLATGDAYEDSYLLAGTAIACQDWTHASASLTDLLEKATLGANFLPLTRGACQSYKIQTTCVGWPAPLTNPPRPVRYEGAVTILQAQSTFDPSTSYAWALGLHAELGDDRSVLLVRNGSGHTSYLDGGDTAAAINDYLLDLKLPAPGTVLDS
ncbi:alpha/beta-hydrolase [Hypoxylon sp. FL1284]|nr:alpha/beta-hydrolase [Hypoxylon sp. FL1284]